MLRQPRPGSHPHPPGPQGRKAPAVPELAAPAGRGDHLDAEKPARPRTPRRPGPRRAVGPDHPAAARAQRRDLAQLHDRSAGQALPDRLRPLLTSSQFPVIDLGEELRGLALISLGITEVWAAQFELAERYLEHGVALARRIERPFLEFSGLAHQAVIETYRSFAPSAERSRQAIWLAERHGWTDEPTAGTAYVLLGAVLARQGPG